MMDYHGRIMNIQPPPKALRRTYESGHSHARHAAAEIALEAQTEIERLRHELTWVRERMSGFCAGSWETTIAARIGRALEKTG